MTRRTRVDAELVRRGLARSRQQAAELIGAGRVSIDGMPASKPATAVAVTAALTVEDAGERTWVSRGAHKLIGALDTFGIDVSGRRCLDAGASTGGFTEVLLDRGAREVIAVDVGYGQLAWSLRSDDRVHVIERTNVRELLPDADRGTGGRRRRRPVVHLAGHGAAGADRVRVRRRRYRSHGEAAVRGRKGSGGRRRRGDAIPRCAPRPCSRWPAARRNSTGTPSA